MVVSVINIFLSRVFFVIKISFLLFRIRYYRVTAVSRLKFIKTGDIIEFIIFEILTDFGLGVIKFVNENLGVLKKSIATKILYGFYIIISQR